MSIIIGGSPSTGSSLLRRMLNRHPRIFCGSETSLLAKAEIYEDWTAHKAKLFKKSFFGISDAGWQQFTGVNIGEDYSITKEEARALVLESETLINFTNKFFRKSLQESGKEKWAEKTPSNAFIFDKFLETFGEEARVIHTVRHPLDAISSMHNRGMTVYDSLCVHMLNVARAQLVEDDERVLVVKYEDLVAEPEQQLEILCEHLGVSYSSDMLEPQAQESGVTSMDGWKSEETAAPNTKSIGRYAELPYSSYSKLMAGVAYMQNTINPILPDIQAIAAHYSYNLPEINEMNPQDYSFLKVDMTTDIKKRRFSKAYFRASNYPIIFKEL